MNFLSSRYFLELSKIPKIVYTQKSLGILTVLILTYSLSLTDGPGDYLHVGSMIGGAGFFFYYFLFFPFSFLSPFFLFPGPSSTLRRLGHGAGSSGLGP